MTSVLMRAKGKLKEPQTCRIFFSSPFGGMEEEREELTRRYFPQIHHACNSKGVQFVAVDMRWGITSQAAENAQVINICLREIDRSDLFVGFFGQRYGWHGDDDRQLQENFDSAAGAYPWLDAVRDRSVTELEFLHGHLNSPGDLPTCICFRDKAYDDAIREEGLAKGDKKMVFKYTSESDHATAMMDDLKGRVKATEDRCLGVDLAYSDPHEGARFMFETIWPYLTEVLLANTDNALQTKRTQQLGEHDAFRVRHISVYSGGQQYLDFLNSTLEQGQSNVLITGAAGTGKSALMSNWVTQLLTSRPDTVLIYHFIGCAPSTTGGVDILQRLLTEAKCALGTEAKDSEEDRQDVHMLQQLLLGTLQELVSEKHKAVVIALDGLDRSLKGSKTSKHLYWLPENWPKGVLFVTSAVDTDTATVDLLAKERQYETLTIQQLQEVDKQDICVNVLKKSGKELSFEQLGRVLTAESTNNPLYLRLVLAELSIFGYFRLLDKKIDSLISCNDVGELLQKMFNRLEEDYNGKDPNSRLVQEVLCAIELSHRGLSDGELMELLQVEPQVWLPLYFAMEGLLVSHAGLLRFGFKQISQAVRAKYFEDEKEKTKVLKKLTLYFDKQLQSIPVWEELLTPLSKRPVEELPWLQLALGDMDGLSNTLLNIFVLHRMKQNFKYEFLEVWKATGKKMHEVCDLYLSAFDLAVTDLYLHCQHHYLDTKPSPGYQLRPLLSSMRELFELAGYPEGCVQVLQREVNILMDVKGTISSSTRLDAMMDTCYRLACAFVDCANFDQGEHMHRTVMDECFSRLADCPDDEHCKVLLGLTHNGIGVICVKQRKWQEAIQMFEKSLQYHSDLGRDRAVADSYSNLGMSHMENGDLQQGLEFMQKSLEMKERLYFGHLPLEIGNLLTNMGLCHRRLNDLDKAEAMYNRSLQVKANAVGWDHEVVAAAYLNLCSLNMHKDNYQMAEQFVRKAMAVYEGNGATLDKQGYRLATENLVCCLLSMSKADEAMPIFLPLFHKMCEMGEMDRCIGSVHREMAKYLLHVGDTDTAREVTQALIESSQCQPHNYIIMDHIHLMLPPDQRPSLPSHCTLHHALTIWPGNPDITRRLIEYHLLPANDVASLLQLQRECSAQNPQWGSYSYTACADWCMDADNIDAATQVLEAGLENFPDDLDLRVRLMDLYRKMQQPTRAYPHLLPIIEGRKDNPACLIVAGDIAMRSSDFPLALQCFDQVCTMDNPQLAQMAETQAKLLRQTIAETADDVQGEENGDS